MKLLNLSLRFFTVAPALILVLQSISVQASEIGRYGSGYVATYQHSLEPEIDTLWKVARIKHPGETTKGEIASLYSTFESALQSAGEELDTGEPQRAGWASALIASYTSSNHKFPAKSKSLDKALMARTKLIKLTDRNTVLRIERKLNRYCQPRPDYNVGDYPEFRTIPIGDKLPGCMCCSKVN